MTAHVISRRLTKLARELGLIPTPTTIIDQTDILTLIHAANVCPVVIRRWNRQRTFRIKHRLKNQRLFDPFPLEKRLLGDEDRNILADYFDLDPKPSIEIMREFANHFGVHSREVSKFFRRRRYAIKTSKKREVADTFLLNYQ